VTARETRTGVLYLEGRYIWSVT